MNREFAEIVMIICCIVVSLGLLYFLGQSIYYYNKIHKLEERIERLENEIHN